MGPDTTASSGPAPARRDARTCIALVAHDHKKRDLLDWCRANLERIAPHRLVATGTTGALITTELGLEIERLRSGPLGGDLQLGAMIAEGRIDALLFFWDPLEPQPHDPDVRALLRIAVVWNVPVACNLSTADLLFASSLLTTGYRRKVPPYPDGRPVVPGPA